MELDSVSNIMSHILYQGSTLNEMCHIMYHGTRLSNISHILYQGSTFSEMRHILILYSHCDLFNDTTITTKLYVESWSHNTLNIKRLTAANAKYVVHLCVMSTEVSDYQILTFYRQP